jgi:putative transposase
VGLPARSHAGPYERHRPELTTLYEVVRENLGTLYGAIDDGALDVKLSKHAKWVLTFPFAWRKRLAWDGTLLGALTRIFVKRVHAFYVERAATRGAEGAKTGAVTVVQRTASDLRCNPHLHVVFLDGAYHRDGKELVWQELSHLRTCGVGDVLEQA